MVLNKENIIVLLLQPSFSPLIISIDQLGPSIIDGNPCPVCGSPGTLLVIPTKSFLQNVQGHSKYTY